jgi:hypothetical protein
MCVITESSYLEEKFFKYLNMFAFSFRSKSSTANAAVSDVIEKKKKT